MSINGWKYYNHAMIPTGSPDKEVDTSSIENGEIWRDSSGGGYHFLLGGHRIGSVTMKPTGGTLFALAHTVLSSYRKVHESISSRPRKNVMYAK